MMRLPNGTDNTLVYYSVLHKNDAAPQQDGTPIMKNYILAYPGQANAVMFSRVA
jgi:hypothetical protein